jgi:formylglycine-generating enzyme required for sulfatase activity
MGAAETDPNAEPHERPAHTVRISKPFALGAYEVTVGQFRQFVEATGYQTEAEADGSGGFGYDAEARTYSADREPRYSWRNVGWTQTDAHPVVNVTWNDAKAFCVWLSGKEGRRYRLPTEAEWEYACRAGTKTRFWTGDEDSSVRGAENMADASLRKSWDAATWVQPWDDGEAFTAPVGRFRPNPWGLFDMHGNVIEWIGDWYAEDYYASSPKGDPQGPSAGTQRVWRGGSWYFEPRHARTTARTGSNDPAFRDGAVGFRVVREQ